MNLNMESAYAVCFALIHVAVLVYCYFRNWPTSPALWLIRADLLLVLGYHCYDISQQLGRGVPLPDLEFTGWAAIEIILLGISFMVLPIWVIWTLLGIAAFASSAIALFFLTFKMRLF